MADDESKPQDDPTATSAGLPDDPMSVLAQGATAMHLMYVEFVDAGFTRGEALRLVAEIVAAKQRGKE